MISLEDAIRYAEHQLNNGDKQDFNICPDLQKEIPMFHYGKCELIKLLAYIYETESDKVLINKKFFIKELPS